MLAVPGNLGKYHLISRIGRGGMGEVYKAFHPQLQRYVAIKLLLTTSETEPGFTTRFHNEAMAVARLRHPHIVQVFDFDIEDNRPYMVMEFIEGETLAQRMTRFHQQGRLLPINEVVRLFQQLCLAVDYAHQQGMLHRDIKPANVIINQQNDAILTDFGTAKIAGVSGLTGTGIIIGTPRYMSPEQAQGLPVDERSDVYSLSLILYELLAGKMPFEADTAVGMVMQHIMTQPLPITAANPAVPPKLADVPLVGIAKNPNERFRSAGALGRAVAAAMAPLTPITQPIFGSYEGSGPAAAFASDIDLLPTKLSEKPYLPTVQAPRPSNTELPPAGESGDSPSKPPGITVSTSTLSDAAASTPVSPRSSPDGGAITPTLSGVGAPPPAEAAITPALASEGAASTAPAKPPPPAAPGAAPGIAVEKRKPRRRLGLLLLAGVLLMLLALTASILVFALGNRGNPAPPPGGGVSKTVIGSVTFSDTDPNDFSHPANTLAANFTGLKQPASGSSYFAWLCDSGAPACASLGPLQVQSNGSASLRVSQPNSLLGSQQLDPNKLDTVITFKITQEHAESSAPPGGPSNNVVYSGSIPAGVVLHVRHELTLFPKENLFKGNTTPLATGLVMDAILLQQLSAQFQQYHTAGDLLNMKEIATYILNLIPGKTAAQDWDKDNDTNTDIAQGDDGFGMGDSVAVSRSAEGCSAQQTNYLPFVIEHACNAAVAGNTPDLQRLFTAIQNAGVNIARWVTTIEQIAHKAIAAQQASDVTQGDANSIVNQADMILNGTTGDVQSQDGARQIFQYAEQMATITVSSV
jgi:serine/threonine-protein kinase